jgi:predicted NAD/FAD-dependent oxidoreductase
MSDFVLEESVRNQMTEWFGSRVLQWKHLKTYRIKYALPDQSPEYRKNSRQEYQLGESVYCCGDYMENASINGAMVSGRKAAEAVLAGLTTGVGAR